MLLSFRVSNFRSIFAEQELSLARSSRIGAGSNSESVWQQAVSTVSGLYGANASGKSNIIKAVLYFTRAVRNSYTAWGPDDGTHRDAFQLGEDESQSPSSFEIEFRSDGVRYQYGFDVDDHSVRREWLYAYPGTRRQTWFERNSNSLNDVPEWYFGKLLPGQNRVISAITRPNSLFLSTAASNKHEKLAPIFYWITRHILFATPDYLDGNGYESRLRFTIQQLEKRNDLRDGLRALLRFADLGICEIEVLRNDISEHEQSKILSAVRTALLNSVQEGAGPDSMKQRPDDASLSRTVQDLGLEIRLHHQRGDGKTVALPFRSESTGTQALVALAGPIFHVLRLGATLFIDEIDTSLHPQLVSEVIELFRDPQTNPRQAQLIFTSHDTSLLSGGSSAPATLDRDQVWFVEKGQGGATNLYPLTDFKPRKLENLERGYLQGRYGAVPLLESQQLREALISTQGDHQHDE